MKCLVHKEFNSNTFLEISKIFLHLLTCRRFLKQTTFESIVAKGENAKIYQFLPLLQYVMSLDKYTFIFRLFPYIDLDVFRDVCCRCVVCVKWLMISFIQEGILLYLYNHTRRHIVVFV